VPASSSIEEAVMRVSHGSTTQFKVGDVVRLKTGGPEMTVEAADEKSPDVICTRVAETVRRHGRFKALLLQKVEEEVLDPGRKYV
jgi:uncharacterized protein YodC (DUF2158 family)